MIFFTTLFFISKMNDIEQNVRTAAALFFTAGIDGPAFIAMTDERLQEIGVSDPMTRFVILTMRDKRLEVERRDNQIALIKRIVKLVTDGGDYAPLLAQIDDDFADLMMRTLGEGE